MRKGREKSEFSSTWCASPTQFSFHLTIGLVNTFILPFLLFSSPLRMMIVPWQIWPCFAVYTHEKERKSVEKKKKNIKKSLIAESASDRWDINQKFIVDSLMISFFKHILRRAHRSDEKTRGCHQSVINNLIINVFALFTYAPIFAVATRFVINCRLFKSVQCALTVEFFSLFL